MNEHKKALIAHWVSAGKEIIDDSKWDSWEEVVQIRANDLYGGAEIRDALEIMKALKRGDSLSVANDMIVNQNHSGMSHSLTCQIVKEFSPERGEEFYDLAR